MSMYNITLEVIVDMLVYRVNMFMCEISGDRATSGTIIFDFDVYFARYSNA